MLNNHVNNELKLTILMYQKMGHANIDTIIDANRVTVLERVKPLCAVEKKNFLGIQLLI